MADKPTTWRDVEDAREWANAAAGRYLRQRGWELVHDIQELWRKTLPDGRVLHVTRETAEIIACHLEENAPAAGQERNPPPALLAGSPAG